MQTNPIEMRCQNPDCDRVFYVPAWRFHNGQNVKFCSPACRSNCHPGRPSKYIFTPEIDEQIKKIYLEKVGLSRSPIVRLLADKLKIPRWRISRRAIALGLISKAKKEPEWSEAEITILKEFARRQPSYIKKQFKKAGFNRSETAIILKRKRLRLINNLDGMSAHRCAEIFGVDEHWVIDKIQKGFLKAERRQTRRTEKQGGDIFFIKETDIREFIMSNPDMIDIRKVEKFYFIELLANGKVN